MIIFCKTDTQLTACCNRTFIYYFICLIFKFLSLIMYIICLCILFISWIMYSFRLLVEHFLTLLSTKVWEPGSRTRLSPPRWPSEQRFAVLTYSTKSISKHMSVRWWVQARIRISDIFFFKFWCDYVSVEEPESAFFYSVAPEPKFEGGSGSNQKMLKTI